MYNTPEGAVSISTVVKDETIWLTQKAMAELFDVEVPAISKHLANIYSDGELQAEATISKMEIVQIEGNRNVKRLVDFYNGLTHLLYFQRCFLCRFYLPCLSFQGAYTAELKSRK